MSPYTEDNIASALRHHTFPAFSKADAMRTHEIQAAHQEGDAELEARLRKERIGSTHDWLDRAIHGGTEAPQHIVTSDSFIYNPAVSQVLAA